MNNQAFNNQRVIESSVKFSDEDCFYVSLRERINSKERPLVKMVKKDTNILSLDKNGNISSILDPVSIVQDINTKEVFLLVQSDFDTVEFVEGGV